MSQEIRVRRKSGSGPTALERLKRLNERVRSEIDRRIELASKYGVQMGGLNPDIAKMEQMLAEKDMWSALEKGFDILLRVDEEIEKARDVFDEVEIVALKIREAELLGADMDTANRFMEQAKSAMNPSSAMYFIGLARRDAERKIKEFREIKERVDDILLEIERLKEAGVDTTMLEEKFEKARLATQYESAMHYLNECEEEIKAMKEE